MSYILYPGDCLDTLRKMEDNSVDSIVTDPPYGLSQHTPDQVLECLKAWLAGEVYIPKGKGFMGKSWDAWVPGPEIWREALRVLKPGGHVLAFAGTRSMDLMSVAIRLAGFELRDSIGYAHDGGGAPLMAWAFGSGFPKSHDVSKAIDGKLTTGRSDSTAMREVNETRPGEPTIRLTSTNGHRGIVGGADAGPSVKRDEPATEAAKQWQGWGSALKPAWEPIILARKPLIGTLAENVLEHGTGALNIDGCRVATDPSVDDPRLGGNGAWKTDKAAQNVYEGGYAGQEIASSSLGRWPANLIHDGSEEVTGLFPVNAGASGAASGPSFTGASKSGSRAGAFNGMGDRPPAFHGDTGSAARFFYCAKASKKDRDEGLEGFEAKATAFGNQAQAELKRGNLDHDDGNSGMNKVKMRQNIHPTVKPTDLMRYLCRLVTPPGGVVLDPFTGSGSTGKAAMLEGFQFVGCELSPEYLAVARARIEAARCEKHNETKDLFA